MKRMTIRHLAILMAGLAALSGRAAVGTLSGPFTHRNLQVFLVHGNTQLEELRYATLSEALGKGWVVVKETGNVQELTIENNKTLFRALWPKLLESAVTESITECRTDRTFQPVPPADLRAFFDTAVSGTAKERPVWKTTRVRTCTTPTTVLFETLDLQADGNWIHKSFINKGKESSVVVPLDRDSRQPRQNAAQRSSE